MAERRHPQVINLDEVEPRTQSQGTKFGSTTKRLGVQTGAKGIGCTWHEVPPGRSAYPCHFHCANEEALFILEGEATARIGASTVKVKKGDFVTFPVGPEHAHRLDNTGTSPLRYLALSTLMTPEVVGYPDSKKFAATAAPSYEAAMKGANWVRHIWVSGPPAGYYDGEDVG